MRTYPYHPEDQSTDLIDNAAGRIEGKTRTYEIQKAKLDHILCARCTHGCVFRRATGKIRVFCDQVTTDFEGKGEVPPDIEECTMFQSRHEDDESLEAMKKIAIPIDVRPGLNAKAYL